LFRGRGVGSLEMGRHFKLRADGRIVEAVAGAFLRREIAEDAGARTEHHKHREDMRAHDGCGKRRALKRP
jgi:hypothetical protein